MDNNISSETERFTKPFSSFPESDITPWVGSDAVGISITKTYPEKGPFIPAKNSDGVPDTVALIKIGYRRKDLDTEKGTVGLIVSINKVSRYLLGNHWNFDFTDKHSPTQESLEESKSSKQPLDLSESERYVYHAKTNQIYDNVKGEFTEPSNIVNDIYNKHLETLTNVGFRAKMRLWELSVDLIPQLKDYLEIANRILFGRKIKDSKDLSTGIFKTYSHKDLLDLTTEKTKILGSDFPITNQTARTFIFLSVLVFLLNYYIGLDILGLNSFIKKAAENNFFLATVTAGILLFLDRIVPHFVLMLVNGMIKLNLKLLDRKIKI